MDNKLYKLMNWPRIEAVIYSEEDQPHEVLGPHIVGKNVLFQTFCPGAECVRLVIGNKTYEMECVDEEGFFAYVKTGKIPESYHYEAGFEEDIVITYKDAYQFKTGINSEDIKKFEEGIHYTVYEHLGAHPMTINDVDGTFFAVWAPNAVRVSVVGDFNHWDGRIHPMSRNAESGIFELFIPDVHEGDSYQFEIKAKGDVISVKSDPYGFGSQLRPENASVVRDLSYEWNDVNWISDRAKVQGKNTPISIYELYLGSFLRNEDGTYKNYREIVNDVITYVKEMGYTHVELMPVMEHPLDASWGYQVVGYYAPTARYGNAEDLMYFIDKLHQAGIGVILDWVPAHFPKDGHGLSKFDGTCLYEHLDPKKSQHPHWGTLLFNYGRPQVLNYLIANALYWVEMYHADGIRIDAVYSMLYLDYGKEEGQWIPNMYGGNENLEAIEFLKHLNSIMKKRNPGVLMIAEESTAWPKVTGSLDEGGLGFDYKWNMGMMNDYLSYISYDPYFRAHHHNELTFGMLYQYSENFITVFSHDEVAHGKASMLNKMPGELQDRFANLRLTYGYMMTHPGKKLLFMGQDFGVTEEFDENKEIDWTLTKETANSGLQNLVKDLNQLYKNEPALYQLDDEPEGFEWIDCINAQASMLAYVRKTDKPEEILLVVANFQGAKQTFRVGVPYEGKYKEILNTDHVSYGGTSKTARKLLRSEEINCDDREFSIETELAPLSLKVFSFVPYTAKEKEEIERNKAIRIAKDRTAVAKEEYENAMQVFTMAEEALRKAKAEYEDAVSCEEQLEKGSKK